MSDDEDRLEEALANLLESRRAGGPVSLDSVLRGRPDLEAALRARLRVLRLLDGLRDAEPRVGDSVLDALSRYGRDVPSVILPDPPGEAPVPVVLPSAPPGRWGRYAVQGEIARGGVGVVLKAHDPDLGRDVALKVLREEHSERPDVLQRFVEEAQVGGQLQHPGVVPVYELGLGSDGQPYFAMRLVKGTTLSALLAARATADAERHRLLAVFQAVCQTVAYAHERRILHRDLKPSNVMVGAFGEVQVLDWGMAKVLPRGGAADDARAAEPGPSLVRTVRSASGSAPSVEGSVLGTPQYMPPEQARGEVERLDERADVFALGAILCEILTGKPPYTGPDHELLVSAAEGRLGPARDRLAACGADPALTGLARRCLSPDPDDRPRNGAAVAQMVADYLTSLDERARRAEIAAGEARGRAASERRARRVTLALASVVTAAVLAGAGSWVWLSHQRQARIEQAERLVAEALAESKFHRGRAEASSGDEGQGAWIEAVAAARRATELAASDAVRPETREQAATALHATRAAQEMFEAAAHQRQADEALVANLEALRNGRDRMDTYPGTADRLIVAEQYARAVEGYLGGTLEDLGPEESARRVQASAVRERLTIGLYEWEGWAQSSGLDVHRIQSLIEKTDPDRFRMAMREAGGDVAALRALAESPEAQTAHQETFAELIRRILDRGDATAAARLAEGLWLRFPGDVHVCRLALTCLLETGRGQSVDLLVGAILALRPRSVEAWSSFSLSLSFSGRAQEGLNVARRAMLLAPEEAYPHRAASVAARLLGDYPTAVGEAREGVRLAPEKLDSYVPLTEALREAGDLAGAIEAARSGLRVASRDIDSGRNAHVLMGQLAVLLLRQGDFEAALTMAKRCLAADATMFNGHLTRVHALLALDRVADATEAVRAAIPVLERRRRAELLSALAVGSLQHGDVEGARGAATEALRIRDEFADAETTATNAHGVLADVCLRSGDTRQVRDHVFAAATLDPRNGPLRLRSAAALDLGGDHAGAILFYREAARLMPNDVAVRRTLGARLLAVGALGEATAVARECVALDRSGANLEMLALALEFAGDWDAAIEAYRAAIEVTPEALVRSARMRLVRAYMGAGRVAEMAEAARECGAWDANEMRAMEAEAAHPEWVLALLRGGPFPTDSGTLVLRSAAALHRRHYVLAARLMQVALAEHPPETVAGIEEWASAAAMASRGDGSLPGGQDPGERAWWRHQAVRWLRAFLRRVRSGQEGSTDDAYLRLLWIRNTYLLSAIREDGDLAALPRREREQCRALWQEVEALIHEYYFRAG